MSQSIQTNFTLNLCLSKHRLNTVKGITDFFMEVFQTEVCKSKPEVSLNLFSNASELLNSRGDFNSSKGRCMYLYYHATSHTLLIKDCITRFLTEHSKTNNLFTKWRSNPQHCSLSLSPGLDYIGFSLAVFEVSKQPIANTEVRVVTTHNNWTSTVSVLSKVIKKLETPLNLIFEPQFVQHQNFHKNLKPNTIKYLKKSSVVFMFKTLNLKEEEGMKYPPSVIKEVVGSISSGTLIFFIDSTQSSSVMKNVLQDFSGRFLYGPTIVVCNDFQVKVSEKLLNTMKLPPAQNAAAVFFVWEKLSTTATNLQKSKEPTVNLKTSLQSSVRMEPNSVGTKLPQHESLALDAPIFLPSGNKNTFKFDFVPLKSASSEYLKISKPTTDLSQVNKNKSENLLNKVITLIGAPLSNANSQPPKVSKTLDPSIAVKHVPKNLSVSSNCIQTTKADLLTSRVEVSSFNRPITIDFLTWLFKEAYNQEVKNIDANQFFSLSTILEHSSRASADFNIACLRRAYLYRYATCHTLLIKGCITKFLTEYSEAKKLLNSWKSDTFFCSLSLGPALDYIAFSSAVLDYIQSPWANTRVRVVTRCSGWEKTVDILSEITQAHRSLPFLKLSSSTVLAGSVFEPWTTGAKKFFEKSNAVFMFKSLDLEEKERVVNTVFLVEMVNMLKPGAVILFIDSSHSSFVMQDVLANCFGKYLLGPISVSCKSRQSSDYRQTSLEEKPLQCTLADFFVWQKNFTQPAEPNQPNEFLENKSNSQKMCDISPKLAPCDKSQDLVEKTEIFPSNFGSIQPSKYVLKPDPVKSELANFSSQGHLETIRKILMKVYKKEINYCNANQISSISSILNQSSVFSANYSNTVFRCAYIHQYATSHINLIKECISRFLTEYSNAEKILKIWQSNTFYCSLSFGPGFDYIAFCLAVLEHTQRPMPGIKFRMVTRCKGWKSTVDFLAQVMTELKFLPFLKFASSRITSGNVFKPWPSIAVEYFKKASLVFMVQSLDLEKTDVNTSFLQELVNILKPGAVILFIDSLSCSSVMQNVLAKCPGSYLYDPCSISCNTLKETAFGEMPIKGAFEHFFIWQKNLVPTKSPPELKQCAESSETPLENYDSKLALIEEGQTQIEKAAVSSDDLSSDVDPSSSPSQPTFNLKVKQENSLNKLPLRIKVEKKHLHCSPNSNIFKTCVLSDKSSSLSDSTSSSDEEEHDIRRTAKPKIRRSLMYSKGESSSKPGSTDNSDFEYDTVNPIATVDFKKATQHLPSHLNSEHVSKHSSEMAAAKETPSDGCANKINLLIEKIDKLASSIENDFGFSGLVSKKRDFVKATEIHLLTKKIEELKTTVESNINNQIKTSIAGGSKGCSNAVCTNCHKVITRTSKPDSSGATPGENTGLKYDGKSININNTAYLQIPNQCLRHGGVKTSSGHKPFTPSIVIPLERISPDLLSVILSNKK